MKVFSSMAIVAVAALFTSCSSEDPFNEKHPQYKISIAKNAEFQLTAGGRTLVSTLASSRAGEPNSDLLYFKQADCPDLFKAKFPSQNLTKEECQNAYACIKEDAALITAGMAPKYEVAKSSFTAKEFYIVNAHSSKDHDAKGDHSDVAGDMHDLSMNGVYIKEFNTNTCTSADLIIASDGLLKVEYDESFGVKKESYTIDDWKLFNIPGYGYYIGMDYHSAKESTTGDGDYSDWVIKVIPAEKSVDPVTKENGNVEINLSVNDEHSTADYIATKLSTHIRSLSNVEVFIPVDKKYYCEADDMDISISHKQQDIIYNTQPQYVEKQIGGKTVIYKVAYEDAGIRVTTEGVDQSVIDYCAQQYFDGVTFEVWNYFKDIDRPTLKTMLEKSTVTFKDNDPVIYVNAFAKENNYETPGYSGPIYNKFNDNGQLVPYTDEACTKPLDQKYWTRETPDSKDYVFIGQPNPWDCTVAPTNTSYKKYEQDSSNPALSNYNVIYKK